MNTQDHQDTNRTRESHCSTRDKILDAAENLFIDNGYAATSMRAIAALAEVNLAATNYHFGSKEGLFAAVFHRRVQPINAHRLRLLSELKKRKPNDSEYQLTLKAILSAFFTPVLQAAHDQHSNIPALIGRLYSEPTGMSTSILKEEFAEVASAFQAAIAEALPQVPAESIQWRFHMMIGSMIHLLKFHAPITSITPTTLGLAGEPDGSNRLSEGISELISFVEHGLTQDSDRLKHD